MWKTVDKRLPFVICHLSFVILLLAGCASVQPVVKIGLVGPFEGQHRAIGYDAIYSARLLVREINESGGIGGYRVGLVALDDGGDIEMARETAVSLTLDPAIIAVVGHGLPQTTNAVATIYKNADIALIPLGNPPFAAANPNTYSSQFREAYQSVTPFNEEPGTFAAPAYEAFTLLQDVLTQVIQSNKQPTRENIAQALLSTDN